MGFFFILETPIFRTVIDLFIAGSETTASMLDWLILYMMMYPEVQEQCHVEIVQVSAIWEQERKKERRKERKKPVNISGRKGHF